jgi:hypothetical protein
MSTPLEDVRYLAGKIGARGTGTPAEAAAADYVAQRLADMGLPSNKPTFRSVPSQNAFPIAIALLALASVVFYLLNVPAARWIAAVLSFFAAWSLWQTIRNAFNPVSSLIPKVNSQNVEARLLPKGEPRRKVVLLAHLDTNRCRLVWQSLSVRSIVPMTWLTLTIPVCMGTLYLIGALLGGMLWWWLSLPFAMYEIGTVITLIRDDRTPYSPGAHDNAASVAVALEVARRFSFAPLQNIEIWFVFDGAEETDHAGVIDLLHRHGSILRQAAFIGLEGLGSGEIVYLTQQGICTPYHPTLDLLAIAETVSQNQPELEFHSAKMLAEDDVRSLRGRGYHAICIAGRDPQTGILPHWHRPDDTVDRISEATMLRAADILCAMLLELDRPEEAK